MFREITFESIGDVLRDLRKSRELSLQDLADLLGCDKSAISRYENNERAISLETIEAIAEALDMRPDVVVLYCIKHRYPHLNSRRSELGKLLDDIVAGK